MPAPIFSPKQSSVARSLAQAETSFDGAAAFNLPELKANVALISDESRQQLQRLLTVRSSTTHWRERALKAVAKIGSIGGVAALLSGGLLVELGAQKFGVSRVLLPGFLGDLLTMLPGGTRGAHMVSGPIVEELLFRGVPLAAVALYVKLFHRSFGLIALLGFCTSLLFALAHNLDAPGSGSGIYLWSGTIFRNDLLPLAPFLAGMCYWFAAERFGFAYALLAHTFTSSMIVMMTHYV